MSAPAASARQICLSALEAAGAGSSTSATADTGKWEPHRLHGAVIIIHLLKQSYGSLTQTYQRHILDRTAQPHSQKRWYIMVNEADSNLFIDCSKNSMVTGARARSPDKQY